MLAPFYRRRPAEPRSLHSVLRFIAPDLIIGAATFVVAYSALRFGGAL